MEAGAKNKKNNVEVAVVEEEVTGPAEDTWS